MHIFLFPAGEFLVFTGNVDDDLIALTTLVTFAATFCFIISTSSFLVGGLILCCHQHPFSPIFHPPFGKPIPRAKFQVVPTHKLHKHQLEFECFMPATVHQISAR